MILRTLLACAAALLFIVQPAAAQDDDLLPVELRVQSASGRGRLVVDRGESDGIAIGDMVLLFPRGGGMLTATVISAEDRQSVIELLDKSLTAEPGTRGEALIPNDRLGPAEEPEAPPVVVPLEPASPYENLDEDWVPTMPLLSGIESVKPDQRPRRIRGRAYFMFDMTQASEGDRSDSFLRIGEDIELENPFGRGGAFHVDAEWNQRSTDLPDQQDESETYTRLDRFSYWEGGTRFSATRWEAGRFLQHGMPEFGELDGAEYGYRLDNGHMVGGSFGFMPEVGPDHDTGDDLQAAGFYRWVQGDDEELAIMGGYQKTWNDRQPDRDLFVGKVEYLPAKGWTAQGTAWIDLYSESDVQGSGPELTQAYATVTRRYESGNGVSATLSRVGFADTIRDDILPRPMRDELIDKRNDRLSGRGWTWWGDNRRLFAETGVWSDEDDNGADAEFGLDWHDLFFEDSVATGSVFITYGEFENLYGGRAALARTYSLGRTELALEISRSDFTSFPSDRDDINQYRITAIHDVNLQAVWSLSFYVETFLWDDEDSWSVGAFVQRSF